MKLLNLKNSTHEWMSELRRSATTQALKKNVTNAELIFSNDSSLKIWFNMMYLKSN